MQQRAQRAVKRAALERREKLVLVQVILDVAVNQVAKAIALREIVHRDHPRDAFGI